MYKINKIKINKIKFKIKPLIKMSICTNNVYYKVKTNH